MAQINFRSLISTENGIGATTGKETAQFFNNNFKITKENLEAIWALLEDMVSSSNIEGIRIRPVQDPDNPDNILYNLFEYNLDGDFESGEWLPLQVLFENLVGDAMQNPQLRQIIESLTPLSRFTPVEMQVGLNTSAISQNTTDIKALQISETRQDTDIKALQTTTKIHEESLRTKANQVLEMFDIVAKGSGYKVGTSIMDQASNYVLSIDSVDTNGGVLSVSLSSDSQANAYYINIINGGESYEIGDVIECPGDPYNALVTSIDANGAAIKAELTNLPPSTFLGKNGSARAIAGTGALVSVTSYPTIYLQVVSEGGKNRIQYYINNDLTQPYDFVAYPDFVNIQKIVSPETDVYYDITYTADCTFAQNYQIGDTFSIDGTTYTGQIVDVSTDPYQITATFPATSDIDLAGDYTTTATTGTGTGLHIVVKSTFHPQTTTNPEFNDYMSNHDLFIQDLINKAVDAAVYDLTSKINKKVDQVDFDTHLENFANPHNVTAEQLGLGNVDNTRDMDKPVSSAVQSELNDIRANFANIKKIQIISTKYYNYLKGANELDSNILYSVGNYNTTFVIDTHLDESGITAPYSSGERYMINGTNFELKILDASTTPMTYTENISDFTEFDMSGTYSLSPIGDSAGKGLVLVVESTEW